MGIVTLKTKCIRIISIAGIVLLTSIHIHSQTVEPEIKYVSVINEDTTRIAWTQLDAGIFTSYDLEYSNDFLSWQTVFSSTNVQDTIYEHAINSGFDQHIYRLKNGNSDTSEWVRTIKFETSTFQNTDSTISLSWLRPMFEFTNHYYVERKLQEAEWVIMDTTEDRFYNDTIIVCDSTTTEFRIFYSTDLDQKSYSHIFSYIQRPYPLPMPTPDTISIVDGEKLVVSWKPLDIGYVNGYYIRKPNDIGGFFTIDSVNGGASSYWESATNSNINFNTEPVSILVSARKTCGGTNISTENIMQSLFLSEPIVDICARSLFLEWTDYTFFNTTLSDYRIYIYENGILVKDTLTQNTNYTYFGLNDGGSYETFIRAIDENGDKSSSSNRQTIEFNYPDVTDSVQIYTPSIVNDREAELKFSSFPSGIPSTYNLLRSDEKFGVYEIVDSIFLSSNDNFTILDPEPDFDSKPYFYRIQVKDSCKLTAFETKPVITLNLQGETTTRQYNSLSWNSINNSYNQVLSYKIYRNIDGEANPSGAIQTVSDLSYQDDLYSYEDFLDFATGEGFFEYYIEAEIEQNDEQYTVTSNILELEQITEIFIPNAFAPNGNNPVFKPVSIFIQEDGYSMYIYNKWGELVFETHDKNQGWDGTFNGEAMPQDVYAYYIKYKDSAGAAREKRGTVTLIR